MSGGYEQRQYTVPPDATEVVLVRHGASAAADGRRAPRAAGGPRQRSFTCGMAFVYPSGHTTAIASLAVCLPLLFAGVTRTLAAAVAAGLVVAISSGLVLGGTHLLSDVVAALLIVAGWSFAAGRSQRGVLSHACAWWRAPWRR